MSYDLKDLIYWSDLSMKYGGYAEPGNLLSADDCPFHSVIAYPEEGLIINSKAVDVKLPTVLCTAHIVSLEGWPKPILIVGAWEWLPLVCRACAT